MHFACIKGSLSVCKWLFENGASGDISKPDEDDFNPMYYACENDHFSVCRWLYDMGAVDDISKPMNHDEILCMRLVIEVIYRCANGYLRWV